MTERWLPVVGWESVYKVSDMGRVKSLAGFGRVSEKIMTASKVKQHWTVMLGRIKKPERLYIHRLVLFAFVGPPPDGCEACHFDGNPANNCLSNLRWDTRSANHQDKNRHGTMMRGEVWREKHKWMLGKGSRDWSPGRPRGWKPPQKDAASVEAGIRVPAPKRYEVAA